jgi:hypothetical protein
MSEIKFDPTIYDADSEFNESYYREVLCKNCDKTFEILFIIAPYHKYSRDMSISCFHCGKTINGMITEKISSVDLWNEKMNEFIASQKRLPLEFEKVLHDNLRELYEE